MALAAGTYRGRLGGQVYQLEAPMGFQGVVMERPGMHHPEEHGPRPHSYGSSHYGYAYGYAPGRRGVGNGGPYVSAGMTEGQYGPARIQLYGRSKLSYSLRTGDQRTAAAMVNKAIAQGHQEFQTAHRPAPTASVTLGAIGLGGLAGALLAAALL